MNEEEKNAIEYTENCLMKITMGIDYEFDVNILNTLLNIIKKLQKENEELKEERQIVGIPVRNKRDGRIGIVLHQWESGSVAVLESINPRVINTHDSWNTLEIVTDEVKQTQTKCETIPIQKIKDKIEEVKEFSENAISSVGLQLTIEVLQELLEGRKI
jgi:hypothetical protein